MRSIHLARALALFLLLCVLLGAQDLPQTGIPPFATFNYSNFDQVNVGNFNDHFAIQMGGRPGRGLSFHFARTYDSGFWGVGSDGRWRSSSALNSGWSSFSNPITGTLNETQTLNYCDSTTASLYTVVSYDYVDATGADHTFSYTDTINSDTSNPDCPADTTAPYTEWAEDGSGYMLAVNQASGLDGVYDNQGTFYSNGLVIDSNGNEISETVSSDGKTTQWFDTLSGTTPVLTISAPNWLNGPITYTFANASGGTSIYTEKYTTLASPPNPGCGYGYFVYSMQVPQELDLPNGQSFVFGYDAEGRVQSVKLPTGSTIYYSYGPMSCVNNTPTSMTRQVDSQPAWQYTQTQNVLTDPMIVTATDPAGNQTQYTFRTFDRYETERKIYQGAVSGGTLLRTVDTCYSGATFPCTGNPPLPITEESVITTLDNGRQNRVDTHYAYLSTLITEQDQYDFGASTPTRKTVISYNAAGDFPRPTEIQILDASGVKRADTTIAYDEGTLVASGITTQISTPTRPRGNPTTISRWIGGSGWVTEKRTYYDTGKLATDTDPNQNTTSYLYDAAYAGAWLTRIQRPTIGGTQYAVSFAYDPATGLMTSSTDENGNITRYAYDDSLDRLTQVTEPAVPLNGGTAVSPVTTISYGDQTGISTPKCRKRSTHPPRPTNTPSTTAWAGR